MRVPTITRNTLCFNGLDNPGVDFPVHTLGWRLLDQGDEFLTRRLIRFKYGNAPEVSGVLRILQAELPGIMGQHFAQSASVGMVPALSSTDECFNPDNPACAIAHELAKNPRITWLGEHLKKARHKSLHTIYNAADRDEMINEKYEPFPQVSVHAIIIVDDFVTRGSTMAEIARCIRVNNPQIGLVGLAAGKNERANWAKSCGTPIDNNHMPSTWSAMWER